MVFALMRLRTCAAAAERRHLGARARLGAERRRRRSLRRAGAALRDAQSPAGDATRTSDKSAARTAGDATPAGDAARTSDKSAARTCGRCRKKRREPSLRLGLLRLMPRRNGNLFDCSFVARASLVARRLDADMLWLMPRCGGNLCDCAFAAAIDGEIRWAFVRLRACCSA